MKRVFLQFLLIILLHLPARGQIKTWTNVNANNNWNDAANWSPNGVPGATDDIEIGQGGAFTLNINTAASFSLNSLRVFNNSTVTFNVNATRNITLNSISLIQPGLLIEVGSTLEIYASNAGINGTNLRMTGGAGVKGKIFGSLVFSSVNFGRSSADLRLDTYNSITNYGIVTVYSGGMIRTGLNTGNTQSSLTPTPTIIMLDGAIYESADNGGSFPTGTWQPNSVARALSPGSNGPGFNGTAYGNLEWNCPFQSNYGLNTNVTFNNAHFISTGGFGFRIKSGGAVGSYTMTVNGNLDIEGNSLIDLVNGSPPGSGGKIVLKGDLNIHPGAALLTNGAVGTTSQLELQGATNQNIMNNGSLSGAAFEFIMNGTGATLLTNLVLPGNNNAKNANLQLVSGKIFTTPVAMLILIDNSSVSGGSTGSFVSGPMQKKGDDDFTFPVGAGSIYAPIGMMNVANQVASDQFTAEYIRANPQSTSPYGPLVAPGMDHVSYVEYWTLTQTVGSTATKTISLDVHPLSFCKVIANTYVSRWSSSLMYWTNEGASIIGNGSSPPYQTGTLLSTSAIADFSAPNNGFTLVTDLPGDANPLPIDLISFNAFKISDAKSSVVWELSTCCSPTARFEIQKAGVNKSFVTVGVRAGNAFTTSYSYDDNTLSKGVSFYRLKMTDADGTIRYSRTIAVMNGIKSLVLASLMPTIITNNAALTISSSVQQKLDLIVADMQGRIVRKLPVSVPAGNTSFVLFFSNLPAGIYQLTGVSPEGRTNTIRFAR